MFARLPEEWYKLYSTFFNQKLATMLYEYQIGVMGSGNATENEIDAAYKCGGLIAKESWGTLTGGRNKGVMHYALKGAYDADPNSSRAGILPDADKKRASEYVSTPINIPLGEGRNFFNIISSDGVILIMRKLFDSWGTCSELCFAMKQSTERNLPVVILNPGTFQETKEMRSILKNQGADVVVLRNPEKAFGFIKEGLLK